MRTGGAVIDLHQNRINEPVILIYSIFLTFQLLRPRFLFGQINAVYKERMMELINLALVWTVAGLLAGMFFGCMVQDVNGLVLSDSR
jgi:hypothetical protein